MNHEAHDRDVIIAARKLAGHETIRIPCGGLAQRIVRSMMTALAWGTLCIGILGMAGGCSDIRHEQLEQTAIEISAGRGDECGLSGRDNYARLLAYLHDDDERIRTSASWSLAASMTAPRTGYYAFVIDAYLDANRGDEVIDALADAWRRSKPGTMERSMLVVYLVEAKVRCYVWDKPAWRKAMGLKEVGYGRKAYGSGAAGSMGFNAVAKQMVSEGDAVMKAAWEEFLRTYPKQARNG